MSDPRTSTASRETYDSSTYRSGKTISHVFSSNMPHRAPVLCYIAGIECPIVSINVQFGVWQIPVANITMFPDPQLQRFGAEDRVPVVAFYLDEYIEPETPKWRLLFDGEIVGWGYTNTPMGRSLSFSCVADMAIFTQLFLFYMTTLDSIAQGTMGAMQQAAQISQTAAIFPYSLFRDGLVTQPGLAGGTGQNVQVTKDVLLNANYIKRPFDFAYNVVRWLISSDLDKNQRCVPAVNFFTRWVRRRQFHNKWVALPFLDEACDMNSADGKKMDPQPQGVFPILRAVQSEKAVTCVENTVAQQNSKGAIFTILKAVLDTVFMELAMLPTAPSVTCQTDGAIIGPPGVCKKKAPTATTATTTATATTSTSTSTNAFTTQTGGEQSIAPTTPIASEVLRIANYFVKPQCLFGLPPTCNVIFPSMVPSLQYNESYVTQPTRLYFQDDSLVNLLPVSGQNAELKSVLSVMLARAWPLEADTKFQDHMKGKDPVGTGKNLLIYPEEFFKGPVTASYPAPSWLMYLAEHYQTEAIKASVANTAASLNATATGAQLGNTTTSMTDTDLYRLYAKYEYFRQRYEQRNGAVICAFQPYLVPGFPAMVFDDFNSQLHLIGYLMNVSHTFTSGQVETSTNFSYARTLYEFFQDVANEMEGSPAKDLVGTAIAAGPADPIQEVRNVTQHFYRADQFYQALFHQRQKPGSGHKAVFDYRDLLAFVNSDGTLENIEIKGKNPEAIQSQKTDVTSAKTTLETFIADPMAAMQNLVSYDLTEVRKAFTTAGLGDLHDDDLTPDIAKLALTALDAISVGLNNPRVTHNLTTQKPITPKPGFEDYFDSYDSAMQYCSRPICTLDEYVKFIKGEAQGVNDDFAYKDGGNVPSARYYTRIKKYVGATAALDKKITANQRGVGTANEAVPIDFPDMRAEWDKSILAYRANVYSVVKVSR